MKRTTILAAITIAAATLSFAGCGKKNNTNTSVDDIPAVSTTAAADTTESTTEAASETTTVTESTTDEPATEPATDAETKQDGESMTFDDIQDTVEPILTGKTDTLDDMVATLSGCGLEFDDEKDDSWEGPEFAYTEKYLKTPVAFSGVDNLTVESIIVFKHYDNAPDNVTVKLTTGFTEDMITNSVIGENLSNYLLDNGCDHSETDNFAFVNDRFSSIISQTNTREGVVRLSFEK